MAICETCGGKTLPFVKQCLLCSVSSEKERTQNRPLRTPFFLAAEADLLKGILNSGEEIHSAAHSFTVTWHYWQTWTNAEGEGSNWHLPSIEHFLLVATNEALHLVRLKREFPPVPTAYCGAKNCLNSRRVEKTQPILEIEKSGRAEFSTINAVARDYVSPSSHQRDGFGNSYLWEDVVFMHGDHANCKKNVYSTYEYDCTLSRFYCEIDNKPFEFFSFNTELLGVAESLSERFLLVQNQTISLNHQSNTAPTEPSVEPSDGLTTSLERLAQLLERGHLSEDEFKQAKNRILGL